MESAAISEKQADSGKVERCIHCDAITPNGAKFCCVGCEAAYGAVHSSGIHDNQIVFSALAQKNDDGNYELTLSVTGIHCASCIGLIENGLYAQDDIIEARVNMSTGRLAISWSGKAERADAFVQIVRKLGYQVTSFDVSNQKKSSTEEEKFLLRCIAVSGFAAGNLMMISVGLWSSTAETMGFSTRDFLHWISAIIAMPTILYAARPFFYSALAVLKERHTNMDVPISLAIALASAMSLLETMAHGEHIYFDSAVMLTFFLLIGRYLDARAKGKARETAGQLLTMLSGTATILKDGKREALPIRDLREGMLVLVASGENITADGIVSHGETELDMSLVTGETTPKAVKTGDNVFAGTTNISAPIHIIVSKATDNNLLSEIVKLMEKAEQGQARYVRLADKAAKLYIPVVHSMGFLTFIGWWLVMGQPWQPSLLNAITVLIITCPCALGLAVPVVQVLASSRLMKQGVLLKSGDALEKLATIDVAIFDKTGTLTLGKPQLLETSQNLKMAASLASHSKHPLSQAICRAYEGELLEIEKIEELPGKGLQATFGASSIKLGSRKWCGDKNSQEHASLELWLSIEGEAPVCFTFSDKLRDDAPLIIDRFKHAGIRTVLLSGDREQAVQSIAEIAGIDESHAQLSPIEKYDYIENSKKDGHRVLMLGDGLNDAPSLAAANISISPSTAVDIAQNTADIVFQGEHLRPVFSAWSTACQSSKLVKQNFVLAVLYNMIAIPMAVMGYVTPLVAALAMSGSSLLVIANSFRLNLQRAK